LTVKKIVNDLNKSFPESKSFSWDSIPEIETISTWSLVLDHSLWWWYCKWRFIEIFGKNATWKSCISLLAIKAAQERWQICARIDAERTLDVKQARLLWVDTTDLIVMKPISWEDAWNAIHKLVSSWVTFIVLDSIAAAVPRKETKESFEQGNVALHARLINKVLRVLTPLVDDLWATIILINQERATLDMFWWINTTWWQGIWYYTTQRIQMLKPVRQWRNDWMKLRYKIYKNKLNEATENRINVFWLWWVDHKLEIGTVAAEMWILEKNWSWYKYWENKFQGIEWFKSLDEKVCKKIEKEVLSLLKKGFEKDN